MGASEKLELTSSLRCEGCVPFSGNRMRCISFMKGLVWSARQKQEKKWESLILISAASVQGTGLHTAVFRTAPEQ